MIIFHKKLFQTKTWAGQCFGLGQVDLGVVVEENKKKSVFAIFSPDLKSAALTLRLWNCVSSKVELLNIDINGNLLL